MARNALGDTRAGPVRGTMTGRRLKVEADLSASGRTHEYAWQRTSCWHLLAVFLVVL